MKWLLLASFLLGQAPQAIVEPVVTGKIVTEDGRQFPLFLPSLYIFVENGAGMRKSVVGPDGVKIKGRGTFGSIPVTKRGNFSLALPNGEYRIALVTNTGEPLSATDGYFVKSMSSGSTDLLMEPLKVDSAHPANITIVLVAAP